MALKNQNFECWQGDNVLLNFSVTQEDGITPLDLTGATVTWKAAPEFGDPATITKTSPAGGITISAPSTAGKFVVALAPADLNPLAGGYVHEAFVTDSSSNVSTVAIGTMTVRKKLS